MFCLLRRPGGTIFLIKAMKFECSWHEKFHSKVFTVRKKPFSNNYYQPFQHGMHLYVCVLVYAIFRAFVWTRFRSIKKNKNAGAHNTRHTMSRRADQQNNGFRAIRFLRRTRQTYDATARVSQQRRLPFITSRSNAQLGFRVFFSLFVTGVIWTVPISGPRDR